MIEMGKQYRTRDGREVHIDMVDGDGPFPVHGIISEDERWGEPESWTAMGWFSEDGQSGTHNDLIEVKKNDHVEIKKTVRLFWMVHFERGTIATNRHGSLFASHVEAVGYAKDLSPTKAIAITGPHEITFTEGEGL